MGASRTLIRKLDLDLIARIEASGRPEKPKKKSLAKEPREGRTYRGARRNAVRTIGMNVMQRHAPVTMEAIAPAAYLNRSDKWPRVMDYGLAREQSGKKEPVR